MGPIRSPKDYKRAVAELRRLSHPRTEAEVDRREALREAIGEYEMILRQLRTKSRRG
jgi:hypothetical protein